MRPLTALSAAVLAFPLLSSAALQDLPEGNSDALLREIETIESKQKETLSAAKSQVFSTLQAAATSGSNAVNLYEKAVEETRFAGKPDKVQAFTNWKKSNSDAFRSREMQDAAAMHIRYLLMSLERADAKNGDDFAKPSLDYVVALAPVLEARRKSQSVPKDAQELLDKPVSQGVFGQLFGLTPWLPKPDSWELSPGNLTGILEKNVRPILRKTKNPQLIETWDYQISIEAAKIQDGRLEHASERFEKIEKPALLFSRADDMANLGLKNRAIQEIIALAKANPAHPDFAKWVGRAKELLAPPADSAPAAPAAPAEGN